MATANELRESAAEHDRKAAESFDRCDTDGFVSQWAHGLGSQKDRLQAEVEENGGLSSFMGLFNSAGERVKAKMVVVYNSYKFEHESKWIVLDASDNAAHWVAIPQNPESPSKQSKMGQLGLHQEWEEAPGKAELSGGGTGLAGAVNVRATVKRTDGGYPEGAVVYQEESS